MHADDKTPIEDVTPTALHETACSPREPLRVAYSRAELEAKLRDWMVKEFGHPRDYINDPDQRDAWYRDNGLLYHFICDHFPAENVDVLAPAGEKAPNP